MHSRTSDSAPVSASESPDDKSRVLEELTRLINSSEFVPSEDCPLSPIVDKITTISGIQDREAAVIMTLAAVGVTAGNGWVIEFEGRRLNGSFNAICLLTRRLCGGQFFEAPFGPIRSFQESDAWGSMQHAETTRTKAQEAATVKLNESYANLRKNTQILEEELQLGPHAQMHQFDAGTVNEFGHNDEFRDAPAKAHPQVSSGLRSCMRDSGAIR